MRSSPPPFFYRTIFFLSTKKFSNFSKKWLVRGGGDCALLEVQKTVRFKVLFFAQKFYLRTLAKNFSLRESSVFRSKVLLTNFRTFEKCESSEIELLANNLFFAEKFYLRTLAKKFSLRESSIFHSKVLFANFRTFEKCEISEKGLLVKHFFVWFKVTVQRYQYLDLSTLKSVCSVYLA